MWLNDTGCYQSGFLVCLGAAELLNPSQDLAVESKSRRFYDGFSTIHISKPWQLYKDTLCCNWQMGSVSGLSLQQRQFHFMPMGYNDAPVEHPNSTHRKLTTTQPSWPHMCLNRHTRTLPLFLCMWNIGMMLHFLFLNLAWIVCSSFADFLPFVLLTCTALLYNSAFNASIVITKAVLAALRCFVLLRIQCKHCSWQFSLAVHYCCLKNQRSSQHAGTRIFQLQHPSLRLLISEKGHQHTQTAGTAKVFKDDGCFL